MKAKVREINRDMFVDNDPFHNCTTTLSELKEMWEDEKIKAECFEMFPRLDGWKALGGDMVDLNEHTRNIVFNHLKNSPRKFTIEQVRHVAGNVFDGKINSIRELLSYLTKLPSQGLEVEIENNKIVKVYL